LLELVFDAVLLTRVLLADFLFDLDECSFALVLVVTKIVALPEAEIGADAIQSPLSLTVKRIEEVLLIVVEVRPKRKRKANTLT
jgi:hypothetical protein